MAGGRIWPGRRCDRSGFVRAGLIGKVVGIVRQQGKEQRANRNPGQQGGK